MGIWAIIFKLSGITCPLSTPAGWKVGMWEGRGEICLALSRFPVNNLCLLWSTVIKNLNCGLDRFSGPHLLAFDPGLVTKFLCLTFLFCKLRTKMVSISLGYYRDKKKKNIKLGTCIWCITNACKFHLTKINNSSCSILHERMHKSLSVIFGELGEGCVCRHGVLLIYCCPLLRVDYCCDRLAHGITGPS